MRAINEHDIYEFLRLFGKDIFEKLDEPRLELERFINNYEEVCMVKAEFEELDWHTTMAVVRTMVMSGKGPRESMDFILKMREQKKEEAKEYEKQLKRVKYLISRVKAKEIERENIIVDSVNIEILEDSDWGLHEADPGYSVMVYPVLPKLVYKEPHVFTSEIPLLVRLGLLSNGIDALDIEEGYEDGDKLCLMISKFVSEILPWRWKRVNVIIDDNVKDDIRSRFPDAEAVTFNEPTLYARALGGHQLVWK